MSTPFDRTRDNVQVLAPESAEDFNAADEPITPAPALVPARRNAAEPTRHPTSSEWLALGTWMQSIQNLQQQQLYLMRDLDARVTRLEEERPRATTLSTERLTFWALWGILMLIMGAALAVVIILIITQNLR